MFFAPSFWLLLLKMGVTAAFVVIASVAAQRAGPFVGAMIATLPVSAGPAYVFLALEHDASFIAQSALSSLLVNATNAIFAVVYAAFAQRHGRGVSIAPAITVWLLVVWLISAVVWTTITAVVFSAVGVAAGIVLGERFRYVHIAPPAQRWTDLLLRAAMVAVLVAFVVAASQVVGPKLTGMLAVFPVVLLSLIIILQPRIGGPATAAVLANTPLGLAGFALSCLTAHLLVERVGVATGLLTALVVSIACNLLLWAVRRQRRTRRTGKQSPP